jgi:hypothetical protein
MSAKARKTATAERPATAGTSNGRESQQQKGYTNNAAIYILNITASV